MVCVCERHALHDLDPTRLYPQNDTIHRLLRRKGGKFKEEKLRRKGEKNLLICLLLVVNYGTQVPVNPLYTGPHRATLLWIISLKQHAP